MSAEPISFGSWLRRRRKALDLTQDALAGLVGCSKDLIVKIEGDARRPSREIAALLASHLQLAPAEHADFIRCARAELTPDRLPAPTQSVPRTAFPPQQPADHPRSNLPAPLSSFLGREYELAALAALLARPEVRLVTLTGPGGTGKTRLSLRCAAELLERFCDGVFFVDLAPISDPELVAVAIAQTLGILGAGSQPIGERLKSALQTKELLLVLDNFEQVLQAAPLVAELLAAAAGVKVLVTSRVMLHLSGEHEYAVPPLALPPANDGTLTEELAQYAAVALFIARAQAARADFALTDANAPTVAAICARLDGLPLAIELAAARVKLFTPDALLARLSAPLALLTGGPRDLPARQQTIRSTIDWSYNLLSADEQALFRRLGVFVGGWTVEVAEAVCGIWELGVGSQTIADAPPTPSSQLATPILDGLAALLDQSLLVTQDSQVGGPRFTMLETLREYALERLAEAGEETETRRRHAEYFVALAEAISAEGGEREHWDERTRTEYANLRAVLGWCRTAGPGGVPEAELGMRLAKTLRFYWEHYDPRDGIHWLRELCGPAWRHGPAHIRARLHSSLGHYMLSRLYALSNHYPDEYAQVVAVLEEGVRLSREIGDLWAVAEACRHCGEAANYADDMVTAEVWFAESLTAGRAAGSPWNIAWTQLNFGLVAIGRGDDRQAAQLYAECLPIFQGLGFAGGMSRIAGHYSGVLLRLGESDRAAQLLDDTLDAFRRNLGVVEMMELHDHRGEVAYAQSDLQHASHLFGQALRLALKYVQQFAIASDPTLLRHLLSEIAVVAAALGHHAQATRLFYQAPERFYYYNRPNSVQAQRGASLAACRAVLGDAAFDAAWAAGQALTLDQAIAEALALVDPPAGESRSAHAP